MKPSNIALFSLALVLILGMFSTSFILRKEYYKTDLDDSLKNYMSVGYEKFAVLKISGSNGYPIEIETAAKEDIKVLRRRISFFKKELKGDTLHITFSGSNIPLSQASNTTQPGIIIQGPSFSQIIIKDTFTRIKGLTDSNVNLILEGNSFTEVLNCRIKSLHITATNNSRFGFFKYNAVDTIDFSLRNASAGHFNKVDFSVLHPHVGDSAQVVLSSRSFEKIFGNKRIH